MHAHESYPQFATDKFSMKFFFFHRLPRQQWHTIQINCEWCIGRVACDLYVFVNVYFYSYVCLWRMSLHGLRTAMENWLCPRSITCSAHWRETHSGTYKHIVIIIKFEWPLGVLLNSQHTVGTRLTWKMETKWVNNKHNSHVNCRLFYEFLWPMLLRRLEARTHTDRQDNVLRSIRSSARSEDITSAVVCPTFNAVEQLVQCPLSTSTGHISNFVRVEEPSSIMYVLGSRLAGHICDYCYCVFHINHTGRVYLSKVLNIVKMKSKILNEPNRTKHIRCTEYGDNVQRKCYWCFGK